MRTKRVLSIPARRGWQVTLGLCGALTALSLGPGGNCLSQDAPARGAQVIDFARDVRPIFAEHCYQCHGAKKQEGGLRLDRKAAALRGGDNYAPAITPGKSSDSPLWKFLAREDADLQMPPEGPRLSAAKIEILKRWIDEGANWPDDAASGMSQHWSFQTVTRPPLPLVKNAGWSRAPIDRFILARLEKDGLAPSPPADRATLCRRLFFSIIGLPPAPEDVAAFTLDDSPDASERLADRLLASPRYGERWARHWLDVVRFAESHGFEMNQPRPNAWPYRDYVIVALNSDLPYDQFVRQQIAGDILGANEATGFLVGGPWDQVKSPDPVLTAQQRADELHDMINTTGTTFLGLTLGCARCHTHKFDPIPQTDYYALKAVFAGVQHGERPRDAADARRRQEQAEKVREELAAVIAALDQFEPAADLQAPFEMLRAPVSRGRNVDRFAAVEARFLRFTVTATTDIEPCIDELEVFTAQPQPHNVALTSAGTKATSSSNYPHSDIHKLEHLNDGQYGNSRSWISNERGKGWVQLEFSQPQTIDRVIWSRDRAQPPRFADRVAKEYLVEVSLDGQQWQAVASSADRRPLVDAAKSEVVRSEVTGAQKQRLDELLAREEKLDSRIGELTTSPAVYAGKFTEPEKTYRFNRGDPTQPRESIAPGTLTEVGRPASLSADLSEQRRRQALADWIVAKDNPLTARVLVNRLWQWHFGEGIVSTPSDFGMNGARPTHPELLDALASELVAGNWELKRIQRRIVASAVYRQGFRVQSSKFNVAGDQTNLSFEHGTLNFELASSVDSANRLFWHFPSRRLEAEPLRDAILAVSGNLNLQMGGPGFDLFEPNTNYVKVYTSRKDFGPSEWRRMIYQTKPRMQLDDTFGAFDCPDAGQVAPKRTRSTTPLQALNLLNSAFLVQQSEIFAKRVESEAGGQMHHQVQRAFALAFQREPSNEELTAASQLVREEGLSALCRALLNANEFVMVY
jgi:mono/diheme cytochrome c family protein